MIKRILVALDNSKFSHSVIEYSTFIAERQHAELTALAVIDEKSIEHSIGPTGIGGSYYAERVEKYLTEKSKEDLKKVLNNFAKKCDSLKIPHKEVLDVGNPAEIIFNYSIFFDLIITGLETHFNFEVTDKPGNTLDELLNHSITPVFAVPSKFKPFKKVLVGFDGSFSAAKAIKKFTHLALAKDLEIKIIIASKTSEEATYLKDNLSVYLQSYGMHNFSFDTSVEDFKDALESKYFNWADVIVVGAHSKRGLLDFIVGSTTKYIIQKGNRPVFIGL